jgi:ribosomal protein S18 acetylase RimI-like enzyme
MRSLRSVLITGPVMTRPTNPAARPREFAMKVDIQPFQDRHKAEVVALWTTVFGYSAPHNDPARIIAQKLAFERELFFVALVESSVVGTVMGGYDGHRGWIYSLAVGPEVRRQGIATSLMKRMETDLRQRGATKINLQFVASNAAVMDFYRTLGYAVEERVSMGKLVVTDC